MIPYLKLLTVLLTLSGDLPSFTAYEAEVLANLCIIEVRDFDTETRAGACWSVIDTVLTRIASDTLTDGTIPGTITYDCYAGDEACQFPAYAVYAVEGCAGLIDAACPYYHEREWASQAVGQYWVAKELGMIPCTGYLYYGIKEHDAPECRIEDGRGVWTNWSEEAGE